MDGSNASMMEAMASAEISDSTEVRVSKRLSVELMICQSIRVRTRDLGQEYILEINNIKVGVSVDDVDADEG